jgi:outer membrane receptor for monomeric catechols
MSYEFYNDDRTVDRGVPGVASTGKPLEGFRDTFFGNPDASTASYEGHRLSATLEHQFSDQFKVRSATVFADDKSNNVFVYAHVNAAGNQRLSTRWSPDVINQTD